MKPDAKIPAGALAWRVCIFYDEVGGWRQPFLHDIYTSLGLLQVIGALFGIFEFIFTPATGHTRGFHGQSFHVC